MKIIAIVKKNYYNKLKTIIITIMIYKKESYDKKN